MPDLPTAYRRWREAPIPLGSANDAIDELHIDIYAWDAIVAECVLPVVDGQQVPPPAIDVAGGLGDLRACIRNAGEVVSGEDLARLNQYDHYCELMQDVYAAARAETMEYLLVDRQTERLVLAAIGPKRACDLWRLHQDPWVATWYAGAWSREDAATFAADCARAWAADGVSKWIAYEKATGNLVGRGGLSRLPVEATSTSQIDGLLDDPGWVASRLEVGWAIMTPYRGQGLAAEIGRAALAMATEELAASRVISFTERHNIASRRVMDRLGMVFVGEIHERGLIEGQDQEVDDAPFVVYATPAPVDRATDHASEASPLHLATPYR
jgi:RimJ/RimL family protein N-acetyltransferase